MQTASFTERWSALLPLLYWSLFLFLVGVCLGFGSVILLPAYTQQLMADFQDFARTALDRSALQSFLFVFFNNAVKTFAMVIAGVLVGIAPVVFLLANGVVIGVVIALVLGEQSLAVIAAGLLPHGLLEIPAILLASALGFMAGGHFIRRLTGSTDRLLTTELIQIGRFFVVFVVPLLCAAAAIEVFLTPLAMTVVAG